MHKISNADATDFESNQKKIESAKRFLNDHNISIRNTNNFDTELLVKPTPLKIENNADSLNEDIRMYTPLLPG